MNSDPIAIIGMAGRFPGACNIAELWRNLSAGTESVRFFRRRDLLDRGVTAALLDDPLYVNAGAVLDDIELFDADFFGFTPREAEITDPQHRVFLECAWEALEDSGYDPQRCAHQIGVYAGSGPSTYLVHHLLSRPDVLHTVDALLLQLGNNKDYVPLRASYKLHLRGPSVNVNTACSSSLVAVHMACQSLLDQQCDIALAGGVGIQVPQDRGYLYAANGVMSPDGHCRAFDARAEGTVSGNGAGIVVLRRYADAVADGDSIRAVILGSAINNDGASKVGFTAPSVEGQAGVIAEALAMADVDAETIGYVEAHGTGTRLGDPIEVAALTEAFRSYTARTGFCALGSVKTNIGHLDEAAGVAGLIKAVLALQHATIPPSLHFERANPEIEFRSSPFYVPTQLCGWSATDGPRRAGVSSFGIGGTNAHVVLQEAAPVEPPGGSRAWQLLLLSARSESALDLMTTRLADHLRATPDICLADVAYTLHVGRKDFPHRRMVLCRDRGDAVRALTSRAAPSVASDVCGSSKPPVVFLFPGQGSQYAGMGRTLYDSEAAFRGTVDHCAELLRPQLGFDLRSALRGGQDAEGPRLDRTDVVQPLLFTIEYALARLLMDWGIRPWAMCGHSLGEYVAACLAGVFSLDDALTLVAARGRLMQQMPAGGMLALELPEQDLLPLLAGDLEVAAVNAPSLCVVAGGVASLRRLEEKASVRGIAARPLPTSHAFHSASMDPVLEPFAERIREVRLRPPDIPFISNLTGQWIRDKEAIDPSYWARHLRSAVRFSDGVRHLLGQQARIFLEVGPGQSLGALVRRQPDVSTHHLVLGAMGHAQGARDDLECLLGAAGRLWLAGACPKPDGLYAGESRRRVPLPTYPFERRRFWLDPPVVSDGGEAVAAITGEDKAPVEDWFYVPVWKRRARLACAPSATLDALWLVFTDASGLGTCVAERLRREGRRVLAVAAGTGFAQLDDGSYILDPHQADHYGLLFADLVARRHVPQHILHLWTVDENSVPALDEWEAAQYAGFYSLLFAVQAAGRFGMTEGLCLHVVSSHMQQVVPGDPACPQKSTVLGPVRVVPLEFPGIRCRSIDLVRPQGDRWDESGCLGHLIAELLADDVVPVTALRGGEIWEETFAPKSLALPRATPGRLREGGTYLITGGLGSMGQAMARYLAREVKARLVLLGRTGLPPESEWDDVLNAPDAASRNDETTGPTIPSIVDFDPARDVDVLRQLEAAAQDASQRYGIDDDMRLQALLRGFCTRLIAQYFRAGGVVLRKGMTFDVDDLCLRLNVRPPFGRFLSFMLRCLTADGVIAARTKHIEVLTDLDVGELADMRAAIIAEYPRFHGLVRLLEHCAGRYLPALCGEIPSISVLYPDGTSEMMDQCTRDTPDYTSDGRYLRTVAGLLDRLAAAAGREKLRILEVGGGSGGLTRVVLAALKGRSVEYHFTDLSLSFVRRAEIEAGTHGTDVMRFGQLDISRDPAAQGYARDSFDIVLGYNVVHATRRIGESVGRLRDLLAPGGLLMLVETTRLRRWDEMIWGLTEGWWSFLDEDLRSDSPLISLDAWEDLLRRQDFASVVACPADAGARRQADAGLIVARKPVPSAKTRLQHRDMTRTRAAIAAVREMRRLGSEVVVLRADVSDEAQMRAAVAEMDQRFGPPDGIIHTAGVLGQGLIHGRTPEDVRKTFAAKAVGLILLDKILAQRGIEPDFVMLCASLASVAPIVGQVDYCAANAFLDAYAASRAGRGKTEVLAIDWGFWQELGMIEQAKASDAWKREILDEIRAKGRAGAGVEAFRCILHGCPPPRVLVAPDGLDHLMGVHRTRRVAAPASEPARSPHPWLEAGTTETEDVRSYVSRLGADLWVLDEHRPFGQAVLPGTAFLELARAAVQANGTERPIEMTDVYFLAPLIVADHAVTELRTVLTRRDAGFDFVIVSRVKEQADEWLEHARGSIAFLTTEPPPAIDLEVLERRCGQTHIRVGADGVAANGSDLAHRFDQFTPHWRNLEQLTLGVREGLATLRLAPEFGHEPRALAMHPALADVATGFMAVVDRFESGVPFCYKRLRLWRPLPAQVRSHVRAVSRALPGERSYDVTVVDPDGNVLLEAAGFTLRAIRDHAAARPQAERSNSIANFCVEIDRPGSLSTLGLRSDIRRAPGRGEVEIEVSVAALNFIEVLYALGMLPAPPDGPVRFGLECAGRIAALGEEVTEFQVGDEVFGFAPRAFSKFATTAAASIARKPAGLSLQDAATLPAAFTTAYYSLITRGGLRRGERVLIHAASGGVGLAAVNIAQWRGAEIFATAGTPEKREYLRRLGIDNVFDSRSLEFAAQVLEATEGVGVDVVLNSLGGEFISASLSTLARHGRFLELGKRDILRNASIGLAPFAKHLSFMAIDVGTDLPDFPIVWQEVVGEIHKGAFRPLPLRAFPATRLADAFEHMAQSRHVGKVVVSVDGVDLTALTRRRGRRLDDILGRVASPDVGASLGRVSPGPAVARQVPRVEPTHARPSLPTLYRPPAGETERKVVDIWQDLLGVAGIGADDNFLDLRGDSLLAAQVTSRLYAAFGLKLPLSSVFEHPTAAGLAMRIEQLRESVRELERAPATQPEEREVEHEL
jgi:acyl transferase domain-containing protein